MHLINKLKFLLVIFILHANGIMNNILESPLEWDFSLGRKTIVVFFFLLFFSILALLAILLSSPINSNNYSIDFRCF